MGVLRTAARAASWVAAAGVLAVPLTAPGGLLSSADAAVDGSALQISGDIAGLEAGVPAALRLTVRNTSGRPVVVHHLSARVIGASGCSSDALSVTGWHGTLPVPAAGSQTTSLRVVLAARCSGATWRLAYTSS